MATSSDKQFSNLTATRLMVEGNFTANSVTVNSVSFNSISLQKTTLQFEIQDGSTIVPGDVVSIPDTKAVQNYQFPYKVIDSGEYKVLSFDYFSAAEAVYGALNLDTDNFLVALVEIDPTTGTVEFVSKAPEQTTDAFHDCRARYIDSTRIFAVWTNGVTANAAIVSVASDKTLTYNSIESIADTTSSLSAVIASDLSGALVLVGNDFRFVSFAGTTVAWSGVADTATGQALSTAFYSSTLDRYFFPSTQGIIMAFLAGPGIISLIAENTAYSGIQDSLFYSDTQVIQTNSSGTDEITMITFTESTISTVDTAVSFASNASFIFNDFLFLNTSFAVDEWDVYSISGTTFTLVHSDISIEGGANAGVKVNPFTDSILFFRYTSNVTVAAFVRTINTDIWKIVFAKGQTPIGIAATVDNELGLVDVARTGTIRDGTLLPGALYFADFQGNLVAGYANEVGEYVFVGYGDSAGNLVLDIET